MSFFLPFFILNIIGFIGITYPYEKVETGNFIRNTIFISIFIAFMICGFMLVQESDSIKAKTKNTINYNISNYEEY